jgi:hypothetical protein
MVVMQGFNKSAMVNEVNRHGSALQLLLSDGQIVTIHGFTKQPIVGDTFRWNDFGAIIESPSSEQRYQWDSFGSLYEVSKSS